MKSIVVLAYIFSWLSGPSWKAVDELVAGQFPAVRSVSTTELQQRIRNPTVAPTLIDVRAAEEFAVSYLPTAINLTTTDDIVQHFPDRQAEIILYCSVGYRSAAMAEELMKRGYTRVWNLQHSLFEWANKGYPMVNADGATPYAHPYNRRWGKLLRKDLHKTGAEK